MSLVTAPAVAAPVATWRTQWLRGPRHDIAMALLWVPFALGVHVLGDDPGAVRTLVSLTLIFSFAHQPLTLWLVYGDAAQRRAHPSSVVWAPVVLAVAVAVGSSVRPDVIALVAGVWNAAHTLRQRYGVCRIYGRGAGIDCAADHRLLWSWLVLAVVVAVSRTDLRVTARAAGFGDRNTAAIDVIASADAVVSLLLPVVLVVAVTVTARWVAAELRRPAHSGARLLYLASTAALFAVLAVHPLAGFVGYVGAHAAEYLLVVRWRIDRAAERAVAGDAVGALARRVGSEGTLALYAAATVGLIVTLGVLRPGAFVTVVVLTLGALHLFFDSVIWRSPRPVPVA